MAENPTTPIAQLRRSPAGHLAHEMERGSTTGERGVGLRELPFLAAIAIRATPGTAAGDTVEEVAGVKLPTTSGTVHGNPNGVASLWLGPDEFLLVTSDEVTEVPGLDTASDREPGALPTLSTHPLTQKLATALNERGHPGQVVDVSANRTTLVLSGPSARATLEKGCPLDLHPREFPVGHAVSTVLGPAPLILWRTGEDEYRLMPRASFADYTVRWLLDAMREYTGPEVP